MGKKILVVDDEKECCEMLKDYLEARGHTIDTAYDGLQAKNLLDTKKYDFIFFDCNMPELSGIELVKVIKEKNPEAKRIMISAYEEIDEHFTKAIGVDLFLKKPFSLRAVEEVLISK